MAANRYYLGIDQGTTGTTVLLLNENWEQLARGYSEYELEYPHPGWVEKDPLIVWQSVLAAVQQVITETGCKLSEFRCLGLDNEGETCMVWEIGRASGRERV